MHVPTLDRDLAFFMVFFGLALALGFGSARRRSGLPAGVVGFVSYFAYVSPLDAARRGPAAAEETLNPLIMEAARPQSRPPLWLAVIQVLVGLGAMVGGAHLFVEELLHVAEDFGVEAIVLSLILAPLATELPEKVNSFFWVREGKDALALGNITGAMVFQSTIPVGIGLIFTDWELSGNAAVSVALGLAGGLLAYWALRLRDRFELLPVLVWLALYAGFIVVVAVTMRNPALGHIPISTGYHAPRSRPRRRCVQRGGGAPRQILDALGSLGGDPRQRSRRAARAGSAAESPST